MVPKFTERDLAAMAGRRGRNEIVKMFCFALALPMEEKVWTHVVRDFVDDCKSRYQNLGCRLKGLKLDSEGNIDWQQ
eukprot:3509762-Alexandrium_andersonii.AAC.1